MAGLGLEIAKAEADERRRALVFEVAQAYVDALNASLKASVYADIGRIDAEALRLIAARVAEGDAAPLERQLLETEIARNDAERALAEGRKETSTLALERIGAFAPGSAAYSAGATTSAGTGSGRCIATEGNAITAGPPRIATLGTTSRRTHRVGEI